MVSDLICHPIKNSKIQNLFYQWNLLPSKNVCYYNGTGLSIAVSIIEDDAPVRGILAGWISRAKGFRYVSEYGSAESAIANLPNDKPDVVLVASIWPDKAALQLRFTKRACPFNCMHLLLLVTDIIVSMRLHCEWLCQS